MKVVTQGEIEKIKRSIEEELAEAVRFAEDSPFPEPGEVTEDVYAS